METKLKKIYYWIKWKIPNVKKAKVWSHSTKDILSDYKGRIEVWKYGNSRSWVKPKIIQFGFSGSWENPYSSFHIYIWKVDIWFPHNPFLFIIKYYREWKEDRENQKEGKRCPDCGSHKLRLGHGFAGEPLIWCKKCKQIIWSDDPTPYCK